jgi:outer membrane lipoprotein-sorting protein
MTLLVRRPRLRWLVPLIATVLLVAGGSAVGVVTATARGPLPHRTAAQLLVDVQKARLEGLSGRVHETADLGLPTLPGTGEGNSAALTGLVSGTHDLQLWYADPQHVRLAVLGSLGESDVVRNGSDLWTWSSADRTATHRTVPAKASDLQGLATDGVPLTPQQLADRALAAIGPSTKVSTDGTATVAGRSAYELVLQPRDGRSLVGSVRIAIDSATHVPVRVQVVPRGGSQPAFEVGFTSFDPGTPPASMFHFTPPPGAKVTEATTPMPSHAGGDAVPGGGMTPPRVVGTGWTSVVVATVPPAVMGTGSQPSPVERLVQRLPRIQGTWGAGRLLQGTLFSAILTDDGHVAVGAVAPQVLEQALSRR